MSGMANMNRITIDDILALASEQAASHAPMLDALRRSGVPLNMSAPMTSEQWVAMLTPGLRKVFATRMRGAEELFKRTQMFPIDTSARAFEDYQGYEDLDSQGWDQFELTGRATFGSPEIGFKQRLEHREFLRGIQAKKKIMDDSLYPGAPIPKTLTQSSAGLARSLAIRREKSAAEVFINSFTDSGVDTDGFSVAGSDLVGLCSTAHPLSPTNTGSTQSNEGTLALTSSNVIETKNRMRSFTDANGEIIAAHPDLILVPPELDETAIRITAGELDPDSAENGINVNKGRYRIVMWDYLTDANAWWMIDDGLKGEHLVWLDRTLPQFWDGELDKNTMIASWMAYARWSRGFDDWRWIYGNNPS